MASGIQLEAKRAREDVGDRWANAPDSAPWDPSRMNWDWLQKQSSEPAPFPGRIRAAMKFCLYCEGHQGGMGPEPAQPPRRERGEEAWGLKGETSIWHWPFSMLRKLYWA